MYRYACKSFLHCLPHYDMGSKYFWLKLTGLNYYEVGPSIELHWIVSMTEHKGIASNRPAFLKHWAIQILQLLVNRVFKDSMNWCPHPYSNLFDSLNPCTFKIISTDNIFKTNCHMSVNPDHGILWTKMT